MQALFDALAKLSPLFAVVPVGFYLGQGKEGMVDLREEKMPEAANH